MAILHVQEFGTGGTPLVFLGSLGSDTAMWLPQLDHFSASRRTIALDHRGHGSSPLVAGSPTVAELAEDVQTTLRAIGVEKYDVVGLSLGGAVAQWLARFDDNVERAVFICTAAKFGEPAGWADRAETVRTGGVAALSDAVVDRWFSPTWLQQHPASRMYYRAMIESTPAEGYALACEALANWDFHAELPQIAVPTLVIAGTEDPSTAPAVVRQISDAIPGAHYAELSPAAHLPNLEQPEQVNRLIEAHLAS
ncbi:3-oxoadipate enol-lactonase [Corynebacterium sp. H128]|uniref:3-oxoadipate enol-lactonase n=1 Tax=Corynebacterium sp. H128 TaxID=3133427 RepID=UPI00309FCEB6